MNKDEMSKLAGIVGTKYSLGEIQFTPTVLSTDCNLLYIPSVAPDGSAKTHLVGLSVDKPVSESVLEILMDGYTFNPDDVRITDSRHQGLLREARTLLCSQVLTAANPLPSVLEQVVSNLGIALNKQIDKDPCVRNKGLKDDINAKLRAIGLETDNRDLFEKHRNLNSFYNASKHEAQQQNLDALKKLQGSEGRYIVIDYFETVIRIFQWYYAKQPRGVPAWKELATLDYSTYGINYTYDLSRRW
jgi:hypothetical protein